YYQDNKEKYLYILKNRKIISNIYSRSLFEFLILYFLRLFIFTKYRIHYDFRGLISDESYLRKKSYLRRFFLEKLEQFVYNKADKLMTVSNKFAEYLSIKYGPKNIKISPCCIEEVFRKRSKIGRASCRERV